MSDDLESWIGRTRAQTALIEPELLRRYAAAVGSSLDVAAHFPPLGHWAFFNDAVAPADLGPDGHPHRGLFLPPVSLPRRMFASAEFRFGAPLVLGEPAELVSTIADLRRRSGRTGELVLVDVERRLSQGGAPRLIETQTIVYREAGEATPPVPEAAGGPGRALETKPGRPLPLLGGHLQQPPDPLRPGLCAGRRGLSGPRRPWAFHRRQAA